MYRRLIHTKLRDALADTRVVLLNGARQTGKSTLAQQVAAERGGEYLTLDDPATLGLARFDPAALVQRRGDCIVIDEIQLAPQLFPAIKRVVDQDRRPGRFLLTGSANIFLLPQISESLAGRIEILPLHPLAQVEMSGVAGQSLVDALFSDESWTIGAMGEDRTAVCERVLAGGFPEAVERKTRERREAWFRSYITSLLQRDIRDLARIEGLTDMPRLLSLLAARSSALMNVSEVSRAVGISHSTLRRYLGLLEALFIFQPLPAWTTNIGKRLVKSPKVHLLDSGLTVHLRGDGDARSLSQNPSLGVLLETFVVQEIRKLLAWSLPGVRAYHFRTATGLEVDLVLEAPGPFVVGIEVKASANVTPRNFNGLRALAETSGEQFVQGVVIYLGAQRLPFGDKLWALPITCLWEKR